MIGIVFQSFNELVEVRINNHNVLFRTNKQGWGFVPIDGLQLNKQGVIKEHPDLEGKEDWREEAIKRFKEHIKTLESETLIMDYIIKELSKVGYKPMYYQRQGHRVKKIGIEDGTRGKSI